MCIPSHSIYSSSCCASIRFSSLFVCLSSSSSFVVASFGSRWKPFFFFFLFSLLFLRFFFFGFLNEVVKSKISSLLSHYTGRVRLCVHWDMPFVLGSALSNAMWVCVWAAWKLNFFGHFESFRGFEGRFRSDFGLGDPQIAPSNVPKRLRPRFLQFWAIRRLILKKFGLKKQ